jgi:hypothetical protein
MLLPYHIRIKIKFLNIKYKKLIKIYFIYELILYIFNYKIN